MLESDESLIDGSYNAMDKELAESLPGQAVEGYAKRTRDKIEKPQEVTLTRPLTHTPTHTHTLICHTWAVIALMFLHNTDTRALTRTSTPNRAASQPAHCPEASGSGSWMAVSLHLKIHAIGRPPPLFSQLPCEHPPPMQDLPTRSCSRPAPNPWRAKPTDPKNRVCTSAFLRKKAPFATPAQTYVITIDTRTPTPPLSPSQADAVSAHRAPKPAYKIPHVSPPLVKPKEGGGDGSYLVLRQVETPGHELVVIENGQIYLNVHDYFVSLFRDQGLDIATLTAKPRVTNQGMYGAYHCYFSHAENVLFAEAFDTISMITSEKIYKTLETSNGPRRELESTATRYIQLSVSLAKVDGLPMQVPKSRGQMVHCAVHAICLLSKGFQMIHITAAHVEMACKAQGLVCFRANQEYNKIERQDASGKFVSGNSNSGNNCLHLDIAPMDGNWHTFDWPSHLKVPILYGNGRSEPQQLIVEVQYKILPSRFTNGIYSVRQEELPRRTLARRLSASGCTPVTRVLPRMRL